MKHTFVNVRFTALLILDVETNQCSGSTPFVSKYWSLLPHIGHCCRCCPFSSNFDHSSYSKIIANM
jgi:hypothetical protein